MKESAQGLLYEKLDIYRKTGDFVYLGSAREPQEELIHAVKGKRVVIAGDRGCGKTTLIRGILQASDGIEGMEGPAGGTTAVHLYEGTDGTLLTDTPGFREWALSHMTEEELGAVFRKSQNWRKNAGLRIVPIHMRMAAGYWKRCGKNV